MFQVIDDRVAFLQPPNLTGQEANPARKVSNLHGIVLAGTHPWGKCPLDRAIPRPLLPVANRPLIRYAIDWLEEAGIDGVTICANSDTSAVRGVLSGAIRESGEVDYYEDPMPRGPAGCLKDAAGNRKTGHIVVIDGTIVPRIHLQELLRAHEQFEASITLVVVRQPANQPRSGLAPMGIYVVKPDVLDCIPPRGYQDIKEALIPKLRDAGRRIGAFVVDAPVHRVANVAAYKVVNDACVARKVESLPGTFGYLRIGEACIHESAIVDPTARCVGPVLIGPNSRVGRDATLVGPTSIGLDCRIADGAVVSRSAIWNHVHVETGAIVDRCIVAHGRTVPSGRSIRNSLVLPVEPGHVQPDAFAAHWPARKRLTPPSSGKRNRRRMVAAV
jgi:NDP-sugar pyrophosphorylase family protein